MLSDGECDEGSVWESALFAPHHKLDNLVVIVDYNKLQSLGRVEEVIDLKPLAEKWRAFGWAAREINGHDLDEIEKSLTEIPYESGRPSCIVAHTVKGKGVSYMEDKLLWHYRAPRGKDFEIGDGRIGEEQMRTAFLTTLFELAKHDERIMFVTGDLGYTVVEPFMNELPKQFLNAGVAEQNMTGMAVGLALSGKIVFTYSIANFPTLRCLEHIRNDVCYHHADVKIVAIGGGFAYGAMGASHHATEELGIMRMLPGITVMAPGDPVEAAHATRAVVEQSGPCYLRLGKAGEPIVHKGILISRSAGRSS